MPVDSGKPLRELPCEKILFVHLQTLCLGAALCSRLRMNHYARSALPFLRCNESNTLLWGNPKTQRKNGADKTRMPQRHDI